MKSQNINVQNVSKVTVSIKIIFVKRHKSVGFTKILPLLEKLDVKNVLLDINLTVIPIIVKNCLPIVDK